LEVPALLSLFFFFFEFSRGRKKISAGTHADLASYRWRSGWVVERFGTDDVGVLYGSKKTGDVLGEAGYRSLCLSHVLSERSTT
jgi:hypothetical protein